MTEQRQQRHDELLVLIDQAIMQCDDHRDMLILACGMISRTREMLDRVLGPNIRRSLFTEITNENK
jgi:hypothetical protein